MDLVDFDEEAFDAIVEDFDAFRRAPGDAGRDVHPDLGAARRQRGRALGGDALVSGAAAALPPRARAHRLRSQPDRRALPGAVGDPSAGHERRRLPRLRRPGRRRHDAPGRRRGGAARRPALHDRRHRHLRRTRRGGLPADVGGDAAGRRHRRRARQHDRAHAEPADGLEPLRVPDVLDVRAAAEPVAALPGQAHHPHGDGRRGRRALPHRRGDSAPRRGRHDTRSSTTSRGCTSSSARRWCSTPTGATG